MSCVAGSVRSGAGPGPGPGLRETRRTLVRGICVLVHLMHRHQEIKICDKFVKKRPVFYIYIYIYDTLHVYDCTWPSRLGEDYLPSMPMVGRLAEDVAAVMSCR